MIKKELKIGEITLNHSVVIDEFGFKRDHLELIKDINGIHTHLSFFPPLKVSRHPFNELNFTNDYTDEEYEEMIVKHSVKFNSPKQSD